MCMCVYVYKQRHAENMTYTRKLHTISRDLF